MIVHPETVADRGCWISDDRVYAFISSAAHGITEIGYHGSQPASRNARVFVFPSGAFQFAVTTANGTRKRIQFTDFDWLPDSLMVAGVTVGGNLHLEIRALGRNISVQAERITGDAVSLVVELWKGSLCTDVHGRRTWSTAPGQTGWVKFHLRDQILLDDWMKRGGPYGSDFLIPEPLRRRIYRRRVRSGLATPEDLLPEYRDSPLSIYDSEVEVDVGGEAYRVVEETECFSFSVPVSRLTGSAPPFRIQFDASRETTEERSNPVKTASARPIRQAPPHSTPTMTLPGFPQIEQFFSTVPGLVDSCVIRDLGIPRATPGGYYWIWAWDAMVTALASLRWGRIDLAEQTAAFVDGNRDERCIPMRWTHTLEPLDTQPPGALESLLASVKYAVSRERRDAGIAHADYIRTAEYLEAVARQSDRRGLFANVGFYPDLPVQFGRTEDSSVAMEVAAFYSTCRIIENCSLQSGDSRTTEAVQKMISALEHTFCEVFWDKRHRFFIDAVERKSGLRNMSYPLFSFLFLHFPPALRLIRGYVKQSADFISRHLLTFTGTRLLPAWDRNAGSETVSGSWYPHWDAYATKLLRRAGCSSEIMTWLSSVERTLERLGYVPEYLVLDRSLMSDPEAWLRHGSASNLNCVTGWYQALLEGVWGLDFDPGGLTIVPLALPVGQTSLRGISHLGTRWSVKAGGTGEYLQELRVDGDLQEGCLKLPWKYHDGGEHEVDLVYGDKLPGPRFMEMANAEVLEVVCQSRGVEVTLNALGQVDLAFAAPDDWTLSVDGKRVPAAKQEWMGPHVASLLITGKHVVRISPGR